MMRANEVLRTRRFNRSRGGRWTAIAAAVDYRRPAVDDDRLRLQTRPVFVSGRQSPD